MTLVTARGPSVAVLAQRSAELEREIARLRGEQRTVAKRLRELRRPPHGAWLPALAGALATALLAVPVVVLVVREPPRPPVAPALPSPSPPPTAITPAAATPAAASPAAPTPAAATPAAASPAAANAAAASPAAATAPLAASPPVVASTAPAEPAPPATTVAAQPVVRPSATSATSATSGALTVVCLPKCEAIALDGRPLGAGHLFNAPTPAGRHTLSLQAGAMRKIFPVEISPNETREVRVFMGDELPAVRD